MYRLQLWDRQTTAMHWHPHHDGCQHYLMHQRAGTRMPVATVLSPVPRGYTAISTHTRDVVTGRQPRPGTRGDAAAGCGFALLVVGAVMIIVGMVVAFLAIRF